ncbi:molybdopterin-dependent oxidoreductase [Williamsia sterculiae]|uniref:molybdopterin-dependent oxidoreductase n=1 Tax=Williamsia sterculiae TaxID=1344003 RepID=UPI001F36263D|nr:molybdopterin-dependent oxidoreductase [Williamsia sterculiae]
MAGTTRGAGILERVDRRLRTFSRGSTAVWRGTAGILAVAVALGVGQLVAGLIDRDSAPLYVVADAVVDLVPPSLRESAISTFGTSDKTALLAIMGIVLAVIAALAGVLEAPPRRLWGSVLLVILGVTGVVAAATRPTGSVAWTVPSFVGAAAGLLTLHLLITRVGRPATPGDAIPRVPDERPTHPVDRRGFLVGAGVAGAAAAVGGVGGVALDHHLHDVDRDRAGFTLPNAADPTDPAYDRVPGVSDYLTDNRDFYRIDTALQVPRVESRGWSLRIFGMVDHEVRLDFDDLRRMAAFEKTVTLTCVSNEVGGDLIGNARWTGYRLADLLAMAHPRADADMVLSTSSDGFTAGTPLSAMTDDRGAMLAVGMNGSPLPVEHGYPARLVIPGLYGYVSATKWVASLEVTRFDRAQAYWTTRGWAEKGPIKLSSRIDVPRGGARVRAGEVMVGGVAWAQGRGINRVEVRVDDGPWRSARLAHPDDIDTWRLWSFAWSAGAGDHTLAVRAFDGDGKQQSAVEASPIPDGSSGLHAIRVTVT